MLSGDALVYYTDETKVKEKGRLTLSRRVVQRPTDKVNKFPHGFEVTKQQLGPGEKPQMVVVRTGAPILGLESGALLVRTRADDCLALREWCITSWAWTTRAVSSLFRRSPKTSGWHAACSLRSVSDMGREVHAFFFFRDRVAVAPMPALEQAAGVFLFLWLPGASVAAAEGGTGEEDAPPRRSGSVLIMRVIRGHSGGHVRGAACVRSAAGGAAGARAEAVPTRITGGVFCSPEMVAVHGPPPQRRGGVCVGYGQQAAEAGPHG